MAMKSTRSVVLAATSAMYSLNHACPVVLAWVAGDPTAMVATLSNAGKSAIADATVMLDWVVLSGSLKPSTYLEPLLAKPATAVWMLAAVSAPQIMGTYSTPFGAAHGSSSLPSQL